MSKPPSRPRIYHITHGKNLASILRDGELLCDAAVITRGTNPSEIGLPRIKKRRLELPVTGHDGLHVGDCVPFYFCPRSVMLFKIHKATDPELPHRTGQEPIVHLQADLHEAVEWLDARKRRWAFSLLNAAAKHADFRTDLAALSDIDWRAVKSWNFQDHGVAERKQAEFLVDGAFPWSLVRQIGVFSERIERAVRRILRDADHKPRVVVERDWYYKPRPNGPDR